VPENAAITISSERPKKAEKTDKKTYVKLTKLKN
jgi:hypothetical protein